MFTTTGKVGIIMEIKTGTPQWYIDEWKALVLWNDGVTGWVAVWGLEVLCK
tara:strand:+ start:150 stop:302 length:153 start_codon:yes stop_codon:yes gene_type:complete